MQGDLFLQSKQSEFQNQMFIMNSQKLHNIVVLLNLVEIFATTTTKKVVKTVNE